MSDQKPKKSIVKRILKWTGITLLLLIVLLIAAPFIFKNKIVAIVKEQANANLNAKVDFGDFDLTLISSFPDFRFQIAKVNVVGIDSFAGDTLAYLDKLSLDINLKSVLNGGPYQINSVVLDKPRILGKVLKSGRANWDIAKPSTDSTAAAPEDTAATKFSMKLKEFKINEAYIVYDDQQGNMYSKLENLNYSLKGDFTQDNFTLENVLDIAKTTFKMDGVAYLNNVHTAVKADLDMDMPKMKFAFKENEFNLNDLTLTLDGYVLMPDTNIDMDLKFAAKQTEFKSILSLIPAVYSKDFASVKTAGKLALDGHAKGRYNAVEMPAFGVNLTIKDAMFKYPSLPKSVNNINIDIKVKNPNGVLDATTVDVNQFHVELAGNPVDITAHVSTPMSDPGIKAKIKGFIDLASVKDFVPLDKNDALGGIIKSDIELDGHQSAIDKQEYEKFNASGALQIEKMNYKSDSLPFEVNLNSMVLNFSTKYVELANFDAMLGKSDIKASGKIENFIEYVFKGGMIKGHFALNSKFIDLNEMMGPESTSTATPAADTTAAATSTSGAFEVPGNIDFNLDANIGKVLYTNMVIENMVGNIVVRNQKLDMTNLKMNTLGGVLTINGYYETTNIKKPTTALNLKVENFDIQTAYNTFTSLQQLVPAGKYAKGMFTATLENFKVALSPAMEPDLSTVDARGVFKTNKVVVAGFPPFMKLSEQLKIEQLKSMEISNLNLNYAIKNGRIWLEPFDTKINAVNTNISGSTGLDQTIDYKWKMEIPRAMFGSAANSALTGLLAQANAAAGTNVNMGEKINVTALFGGTVTKPTVKTGMKEDSKAAVTTVTTAAFNAGVDKAAEEAKRILEEAKAQCEKQKGEAQVKAEQEKQNGYAAADKAVEQASNPLAKMAAKKAAEIAKKEVDKKVVKIIEEAEARCIKQMEEAQAKAAAKAAESKK